MNPINRRLAILETALKNGHVQQAQPTRQVTQADLDALYCNWAYGTPLPPGDRDPQVDAELDRLYDRILQDLNGRQP
jgi:hypothetical protein